MSTSKSIVNWFEAAKPQPTVEDLSVQIGCHLEEVSEMLAALGLKFQAESMKVIADGFKAKNKYYLHKLSLCLNSECQLIELVDSLPDQHVTGLGVLKFLKGLNITSGDLEIIEEVNESNWSKYNGEGLPCFDENGKIKKGPDYMPPNIKQFIKK